MAKHKYLAALFQEAEGGWSGTIPGPNVNFQAKSIDEALNEAREILESVLTEDLEERGTIEPSWSHEAIMAEYGDLGAIFFCEVEAEIEQPIERVTMTIPKDVLVRVKNAGVTNRSAFFAAAAIEKLENRAS